MMTIKQVSVFLENKTGKLTEALDCLAKAHIDIMALTIADTTEYGILRMIVSDADKAHRVLSAQAFSANTNNVFALEIEKNAGSLRTIVDSFSQEGLSIDYVYVFGCGAKAVMILRTTDNDKALGIIAKYQLKLVSEQEINANICLE